MFELEDGYFYSVSLSLRMLKAEQVSLLRSKTSEDEVIEEIELRIKHLELKRENKLKTLKSKAKVEQKYSRTEPNWEQNHSAVYKENPYFFAKEEDKKLFDYWYDKISFENANAKHIHNKRDSYKLWIKKSPDVHKKCADLIEHYILRNPLKKHNPVNYLRDEMYSSLTEELAKLLANNPKVPIDIRRGIRVFADGIQAVAKLFFSILR